MTVKALFAEEGIEKIGVLPFARCPVTREDFITRQSIAPAEIKSVLLFLVPYYVGKEENANISLYARSLDYHAFCDGLFERLTKALADCFHRRFFGFADKSPIPETVAAAMAGLGVLGDNHLLINDTYGSFVFIGEILSDATPEELGYTSEGAFEAVHCPHCGACRKACPMTGSGMECLSAVTQKKGALTPEEERYILENGYVWGCDICQLACPLVQKALKSGKTTPIPFFRENRMARLTSEAVLAMDDTAFAARAFSWRGRNTVLRNLALWEEKEKPEKQEKPEKTV